MTKFQFSAKVAQTQSLTFDRNPFIRSTFQSARIMVQF